VGLPEVRDSAQPLVSVLTPVYNGERYLGECIESVLGQSYQNWEYIIVNNCSTDRTEEIIAQYARRDPRVRVIHNTEFVSALKNHNIALMHISPSSKYCKFVQADDLMFSTCLAEMVNIAESNPSVGIVSSYQLYDGGVKLSWIPYPSTVIPGHDVCRTYFLGRKAMFGTMGGFLLRSDIVRSRTPFLNEKYLFADLEVYFMVLSEHDYGFVHQVLGVWRTEPRGLNAFARSHNEWVVSELYFTMVYGQVYLSAKELDQCLKESMGRYYRCLAHDLFHLREDSFWQYHRRMLREFGLSFSWLSLFGGAILEVTDVLVAPIRTFAKPIKRIWNNRPRLRQKRKAEAS
jgi:glycosyltransferase involved in cell wall biosynthesis